MPKMLRLLLVTLFVAGLAGCAQAPAGQLIADPYEQMNRKTHAFNKGLDRGVVSPVADAYGRVVGPELDSVIVNAAETISLPNRIVNKILQLRLISAIHDTMRLTLNVGLSAGTKDVGTEFGLPNEDTDFGQTLHIWGFGEGNYLELPFFGASTERDAVGLVVDTLLLDPLGQQYPETQPITAGVTLTSFISSRNEFADLVDTILYESEDSYTAQQSAYVQNRRFILSKSGLNDAVLDDPYGDELLDDLFDEDF